MRVRHNAIRFFLIIYLIFLKKIETSNRTVYQDQRQKEIRFYWMDKTPLTIFLSLMFGSIEAFFDHFECGSPWQNQIDFMSSDSMFFQCSFKFHCLSLYHLSSCKGIFENVREECSIQIIIYCFLWNLEIFEKNNKRDGETY